MIDFLFSQLFVLVLKTPPSSLSHCFHLAADCKQTHTNDFWLNAERLQLAAKATGEFCCAVEVTWQDRNKCCECETV